jgi:transposase-like protein
VGLFKRRQFHFCVSRTVSGVVFPADESVRPAATGSVAVRREPSCPMCVARRTVRTGECFRTDTFFCPSCNYVWEVRKPRALTE